MERTPKLETVCPGCGTTWVGSNGFASTSYDFPSNNPTSCPTHRAALELLEALESLEIVARSYLRYPLEGEEPGYSAKDVLAYCIGARAAIEAARKS